MSPSAGALLAIVGLPFLGAALVPLVYRVLGERTAYFAAGIAAVCFALVASQAGSHGTVVFRWIPSLSVSLAFYVDGLAVLIGLLASGVGVLVFVYSAGYMHAEPGKLRYYATMLAFMGAMLGVAFAADLVALFLFWELTSVASFLLIGHYQDDAGQYAARKSMVITVAGGLFMLVGFLLLHHVAAGVPAITSPFRLSGPGSMLANAGAMQDALRGAGLFVPALLLVGVGAAAKSAQVPLHIWLPNAMEAPTPVSAFLHSATMVKAGVYLVGRFRPLLTSQEWVLLFVALGLVTMTVTAALAVSATDIKELLAYSTASHLGLIVAGFGVWSAGGEIAALGAETGAFHVLNHALFKAALFLVAGIVAHEAGTRAIDDLGGLWRDLPITAGVTAVAALGMAGVPPFNGFYSKELLFEATHALAAHEGGLWWLLPVVAVLGSVFTFLYSIRFLMLFFGDRPDGLGHVHAPPTTMLAPAVLLAALAAFVGLGGIANTVGVHLGVDGFVSGVVASALGGEAHFTYHLPTHVTAAGLMSAATIGIGIVAYPFYHRLRDGVRVLRGVRPLKPNWYYDGATDLLDRSRVADAVHTGLLRTYALWFVFAISALALGGYAAAAVHLPAFAGFQVTLAIGIVLAVAAVGAAAVTRAPSHIAGVLTLSILGFMIAIFYILADAPDLALTQLVVETLVLVIFLLVLDKLPAFYGDADRARLARDGVVAAVVGATVTVTVLLSTAGTPGVPDYLDRSLAAYFLHYGGVPAEHGSLLVNYGGGHNIVNVILVDFRAFDTMGEISVVSMAALSVITLVAMRRGGETA
ncbi:MAG: hydrogen gas-evolving membrane-bound hydrogenase subunit E [Haloarculaceae archaeon]